MVFSFQNEVYKQGIFKYILVNSYEFGVLGDNYLEKIITSPQQFVNQKQKVCHTHVTQAVFMKKTI